MMKRNIVLIGMPGAGKSTVGVILAKTLNYDFIDTDLIIQRKTGEKLYETIQRKGLDEFLDIENTVLSNVNVDNTVIATGGSAVFGSEAMEHLGKTGIIVYLKLECTEIARRINNITTRGIAMKPGKTIEDVYNERVPLYEKYSDVVIDGSSSPERVVEKIKIEIDKYNK